MRSLPCQLLQLQLSSSNKMTEQLLPGPIRREGCSVASHNGLAHLLCSIPYYYIPDLAKVLPNMLSRIIEVLKQILSVQTLLVKPCQIKHNFRLNHAWAKLSVKSSLVILSQILQDISSRHLDYGGPGLGERVHQDAAPLPGAAHRGGAQRRHHCLSSGRNILLRWV